MGVQKRRESLQRLEMDAARGIEAFPLLVSSSRETISWDFEYVRDTTPAPLAATQSFDDTGAGLYQDESNCSCHTRFGSSSTWSAVQQDPDAEIVCVGECGPACACWHGSCLSSYTGEGARYPFTLKSSKKGWGVHCLAPISRGSALFTYAGERLSNRDADERLRAYDNDRIGHALLPRAVLELLSKKLWYEYRQRCMQVVRQHLPSGRAALRFNIDATRRGNIARFVNHRCGDPSAALAIVWRCGEFLPVVALVARHDLQPGDEVTWCYGGTSSSPEAAEEHGHVALAGAGARDTEVAANQQQEASGGAAGARERARREVCHCGSSLCAGLMPLR